MSETQISGCPALVEGSPLNVLEKPCIGPEKIGLVLVAANSPAQGYYQEMYDLGLKYKVNPEIALAFFRHESNYGTKGVAVNTKSIGNIIYTHSCPGTKYISSNGQEWCRYNTWAQGMDHWYSLISGPVYAENGLDTVEEIVPKYAPESENNVGQYIASVRNSVKEYRG